MNIFAGNILVPGDTTIDLPDFDVLESFSTTGEKSIYIFGETELKTNAELRELFERKLGNIQQCDITVSTEAAIGITPYDYESGVYECARFEGENVGFEEIADRFEDVEGVFAIREAEQSEFFGNKVVRVDFIY